ncbi:hypothetical protein FHS15_003925 [Paenibacillus castaneae]|nr:hypothetical protein [Paenibacillus castaneae]
MSSLNCSEASFLHNYNLHYHRFKFFSRNIHVKYISPKLLYRENLIWRYENAYINR